MSADRPKQRQKANKHIRGTNTIDDMVYNEQAGAKKSLRVDGKLKPLGSISTAVNLQDSGKTIAVLNPTGGVLYFKSGASGITAPTGAADGIAVLPNSYFYAAMAEDVYIIGQAGLFAYEVLDDSYWG